ncbi:histidine kinase [Streptomyces cinnamoneus]|uniref:sensor histidine kinase n=1 Tax=Streptomyces cinnamoneus TaxID=53446 RepID=UPI0033D8F16D
MGMRSWVREWRGRSKVAQVDSYMRWTLYGLPWLFPLTTALSWLSGSGRRPGLLVWLLLSLCLVQCAQGVGLLRRSLDHYLRKQPAPWWGLGISGAFFALTLAVFVAVVRVEGVRHVTANVTVLLHGGLIVFGSYSLLTRRIRTYLAGCALAGLVVGGTLAAVAARDPGPAVLVAVLIAASMVFALGVWGMAAVRASAWFLRVLWELEAARGTQARLAVAEERLRFSRDMHDVLGRNLAVIALKSELAAQLSRRGSSAALDEMTEVQQIARESQRELREVVRGYREAALHTELVGARSVLAAAGIECRTDDAGGAELPPAVESALGWVVREATTNVLRHAEATRCTVRLRVADGAAVLVMENDGVRDAGGAGPSSGGGSGLAGLRERLTALGGTVSSLYDARRTFRLTARIPLAGHGSGAEEAAEGAAAVTAAGDKGRKGA